MIDVSRINNVSKSMSPSTKNFDNKKRTNIFFSFGKSDEEHILRLVGEIVVLRKHWIGSSPFNPVKLYDDDEFTGEDKLPMQINCNNWDSDEECAKDNGCPICLVHNAANTILHSKDAEELPQSAKTELENIRKKSSFRTRGYVNVIDRNNPEIGDGEKGYKIAELNSDIINGLAVLVKDLDPIDITSIEDGIDIKITKTGSGTNTKYTVSPVLKSGAIKTTPLTDEEKSWELHNIKTICGKHLDKDMLFDRMLESHKDMVNSVYNSDNSNEDEDDGIPF